MGLTGVTPKKVGNARRSQLKKRDLINNDQQSVEYEKAFNQMQGQIQDYEDFIEEFKSVLSKDRDEITKLSEELELDLPKNAADRDKLAAIFDKMLLNMLGD